MATMEYCTFYLIGLERCLTGNKRASHRMVPDAPGHGAKGFVKLEKLDNKTSHLSLR